MTQETGRKAILEAARRYFERHGYERATIRAIAAEAGVDPALVHHYFGNKERLLVAALRLPVNPREILPQILEGPAEEIGERLLRRALSVWGADSAAGGHMIRLIRTSITHENAAYVYRHPLPKVCIP